MFAAKFIVPAIAAAAGLAFAASPAKADSFSIAAGGCQPPVVYRPPVCTPAPGYTAPAPVIVYRPYHPAYYRFNYSYRDHDRWNHHDRHDRDHDHDHDHDHDGHHRR